MVKCANWVPKIQLESNYVPIRTSFVATLLGLAAASVAPAASFSFNSSNEGFTSSFNTAPFDGPWTYAASGGAGGTGAWSTEGQAPEIQHPTTTDLTSPG